MAVANLDRKLLDVCVGFPTKRLTDEFVRVVLELGILVRLVGHRAEEHRKDSDGEYQYADAFDCLAPGALQPKPALRLVAQIIARAAYEELADTYVENVKTNAYNAELEFPATSSLIPNELKRIGCSMARGLKQIDEFDRILDALNEPPLEVAIYLIPMNR